MSYDDKYGKFKKWVKEYYPYEKMLKYIFDDFESEYDKNRSKCNDCYHYNTLLTPQDGWFEQCMEGELLHQSDCKKYEDYN